MNIRGILNSLRRSLKIKVLLIGGYGNFGKHIAKCLAQEKNIELIIAGRNLSKAEEFAKSLNAINPAKAAKLDIDNNILESLSQINPNLVIHTSGPYQEQSYKGSSILHKTKMSLCRFSGC